MTTLISVSLIEEDGQLSINYENGDPTLPIKPETIERLIEVLGQMREEMTPPRVPLDPQFGQTMQAIHDPRWHVANALGRPDALLSLHHPGYGWTRYALPLASAQQFHHRLTQAIESIQSLQGGE